MRPSFSALDHSMMALKVIGRLAQPPDHRVAAGLDALGDRDLALAGEQLDGAHLAQVHAHGIVRAVDGFLLLLDDEGAALAIGIVVQALIRIDLGRRRLVVVRFLVLDDVYAHLAQRGHDVLDLIG
jgi:hypothetical protein